MLTALTILTMLNVNIYTSDIALKDKIAVVTEQAISYQGMDTVNYLGDGRYLVIGFGQSCILHEVGFQTVDDSSYGNGTVDMTDDGTWNAIEECSGNNNFKE